MTKKSRGKVTVTRTIVTVEVNRIPVEDWNALTASEQSTILPAPSLATNPSVRSWSRDVDYPHTY